MEDTSAYICGELESWPSKGKMARILRKAGLHINVGKYSIRINDCSHFVFQEYGGDLGDPQIDADADSAEMMLIEAKPVSDALANAGIKHRFEIYDHPHEHMKGYLHHDWPRKK
jgi:hypothetical protein